MRLFLYATQGVASGGHVPVSPDHIGRISCWHRNVLRMRYSFRWCLRSCRLPLFRRSSMVRPHRWTCRTDVTRQSLSEFILIIRPPHHIVYAEVTAIRYADTFGCAGSRFRSHHNHAVGCTRTVQSRRAGSFQYLYASISSGLMSENPLP